MQLNEKKTKRKKQTLEPSALLESLFSKCRIQEEFGIMIDTQNSTTCTIRQRAQSEFTRQG